jgi:hypothetical protein
VIVYVDRPVGRSTGQFHRKGRELQNKLGNTGPYSKEFLFFFISVYHCLLTIIELSKPKNSKFYPKRG